MKPTSMFQNMPRAPTCPTRAFQISSMSKEGNDLLKIAPPPECPAVCAYHRRMGVYRSVYNYTASSLWSPPPWIALADIWARFSRQRCRPIGDESRRRRAGIQQTENNNLDQWIRDAAFIVKVYQISFMINNERNDNDDVFWLANNSFFRNIIFLNYISTFS